MAEWTSTTATYAPREVMDIRQAAEFLGISADTLYKYAGDGFKLGNRWRFRRSSLSRWMMRQEMKSSVSEEPHGNQE